VRSKIHQPKVQESCVSGKQQVTGSVVHGADHQSILVPFFPQPEISEALKENAFHRPLDFHPALRMIEKILIKANVGVPVSPRRVKHDFDR
jgi:hypothetical protein